ncbi:glycogen phosphorylase, putative [Entamoeba histolytica KU27]|nr:glycogen phosphorylase, putative [Entamoeba histolytica KU27]
MTTQIRRSVSMNKLKAGRTTADGIPINFGDDKFKKLWDYCSMYLSKDVETIKRQIANHLEYTLACNRLDFRPYAIYQAAAYSLRDRMLEFWNDTQSYFTDVQTKRVYYMSIEYLIGRSLMNSICNLDLEAPYTDALKFFGSSIEELYEYEEDAALGSGGLGRLAACFLDSLATLNYPAWGYGIRYQYGMFKQGIVGGYQVEMPEYWLEAGNPWEIVRQDVKYEIKFGGHVVTVKDVNGKLKYRWENSSSVNAVAFDMPIPGYKTLNTLNLRLWSSQPVNEFDLEGFNGDENSQIYWNALDNQQKQENICKVLYPKNNHIKGQELRLKQEYFFSSATILDVMRRFKKMKKSIDEFPDYNSIQLNDTHPVVGALELMRVLIDIEGVEFEEAFDITNKTFSYTNHTVLPEALETWPVDLFGQLLPRHLQLAYQINQHFLDSVKKQFPHVSGEQLSKLSLVEESTPKRLRMANLAIICSHTVNGVAAIHSQILKDSLFNHFYVLWPHKFINVTNGVTPRRWIKQCNPALSQVITEAIKTDEWVSNLSLVKGLENVFNHELIEKFIHVKQLNKDRLKRLVFRLTDSKVVLDRNALFDVMVKRIHEYKRQLLNLFGTIHTYLQIKKMTPMQRMKLVPRVKIFAGKAAIGYDMAKGIIKLINSVADTVNNDPEVGNLLKVVFIPNYSVSLAEVIIPANDINEQISTAGYEASGTSCMKFVMNGGLIVGTWDGANVEIAEEVGEENMFMFGAKAYEVAGIRANPIPISKDLAEVLAAIDNGMFGDASIHKFVIDQFRGGSDYYLVCRDFDGYVKIQEHIDSVWKNPQEWTTKCIRCVARMGKFSSDRSIEEYASNVWNVQKCPLPVDEQK